LAKRANTPLTPLDRWVNIPPFGKGRLGGILNSLKSEGGRHFLLFPLIKGVKGVVREGFPTCCTCKNGTETDLINRH